MFSTIQPTRDEERATLPGDTIVAHADVVMNRAFSLTAKPEKIWPWFVQLGKNRAGWYFPHWVEKWMMPKKRALRSIDPKLQNLKVGHVIDDWGGKNASFKIVELQPNHYIVHMSKRGTMLISWTIILTAIDANSTRVHLRLRLGNVRQKWLAQSAGEFIDLLTIAGLAAGLKERLRR